MMIIISTPDDVQHHLPTIADGSPNIEGYSTSPNTRAALQAAYDRGDWQTYTPPEPEPVEPEPQWDLFNLAILTNAEFNAAYNVAMASSPLVAAALPAALTQVSTGSTAMIAVAFNALCQVAEVAPALRATWAGIAENHYLPSEFVEVIRGQ